jgi:hypothetical protein
MGRVSVSSFHVEDSLSSASDQTEPIRCSYGEATNAVIPIDTYLIVAT